MSKKEGAVAHATASIFVRIGVRIKRYQSPKQKHVQQIFDGFVMHMLFELLDYTFNFEIPFFLWNLMTIS